MLTILQAPVIFTRMVITCILAAAYTKTKGIANPFLGPKEVRSWLVLRGLCGAGSLYLFYNSFRFLALADSLSIWFTAPIIISVLAAIALKEPYTRIEAICGLVSLLGVTCVTRPPFIFGGDATESSPPLIGFALAMSGTFLGAVVFIIVRHIGDRADALFFVLYHGYMAAIVMAILMMFDSAQRIPVARISGPVILYLLGVCIGCLFQPLIYH